MKSYAEFVAGKRLVAPPAGLDGPFALSPLLMPFQADLTAWALRRGRAAIWADCGLGKSWMALEWARVIVERTGGRALILTPLAVARQFEGEGRKLGIPVRVLRDGRDAGAGINVINYDRLHLIDPAAYVAVVADESSCLKDYTSATRNALIEAFAGTPYRLACTATPAPNDYMELGNHAEFLGVMNRTEMLSMFFCHDGGDTQSWRLKGHAEADFWRWLSSWAANVRRPSDLGYPDGAFLLPAMAIKEHVVESDLSAMAREAGQLFVTGANTLIEQRAARRESLAARVGVCVGLANASDEAWLIWCDLNAESEALAAAIPDAVEVRGSDDADEKERRLFDFIEGRARVLVTKPSIAGWGLNLQHCRNVAFVGLSHSFEAWYQAVRRSWRFGQAREVRCHLITSSAEGAVLANLKRKQADAERMDAAMVEHMRVFVRANVHATGRESTGYAPSLPMAAPAWEVGA